MGRLFKMISLLYIVSFVDSNQRDIRCYSCTTIDPSIVLSQIHDPMWLTWLENLRFVPKSQQCQDPFTVDLALRDGVKNQICENGLCLKMVFEEKSGMNHVFRSCIPNANVQVRSDCTKISSGEGDLEVCLCEGYLCNSSNSFHKILLIILGVWLII